MKQKRFVLQSERILIVLIAKYLALISIFSILGLIFGKPTPIMISFHILSIALLSIRKSIVLFNSLLVPVSLVFIFVSIDDLLQLEPAFFFHLINAIISLLVFLDIKRRPVRLDLMITSSLFFFIWIVAVQAFLPDYYQCLFGICGITVQIGLAIIMAIPVAVRFIIMKKSDSGISRL